MEKYSKWRDKSTGIQPLVPIKPNTSNRFLFQSIISGIKSYVLGPPFALIKLTAIISLASAFAVLELLGLLFVAIPFIHRGYTRLIYFLFIRTILILLGYYWIFTDNVSLKKRVRGSSAKSKSARLPVLSGDIIAANHTSYIDVLYFACRYAPTFVTPTEAPGQVTIETLYSALCKSIKSPPLHKGGEELSEVSRRAKLGGYGPIVVFPEGTTSNGRGILKLTQVFKHLDPSKTRLHVIGLKYEYEEFAPTFTVNNFPSHIFLMACQWVNTLKVRCLHGEEADILPTLPPSLPPNEDEDIVGAQIANALHHATRLRQTISLGVKEKQQFITYYMERERKTKK